MLRLLQAGQAAAALTIAKNLVAKASQAPDAYQLLGMCHAESGDSDQAEQAFLQALELAPNHPLVLVNFATMLRKAGRLEAAITVLQKTVDAAPDFAKAWSELGITALRAGRPQQALVALTRSVALLPDSVPSWHALGNALHAGGDMEAAEAAFRKVISLAPEHPSASSNLGTVLRQSGRPDEAIVCFMRIRKNVDDDPELADSLVGAMLDDGRLEESLALSRQVTKQHPDFIPAHVTLANLLWEHGSATMAGDDPFGPFRAEIQRQPSNEALRVAFIQVLLSARLAEEALDQLRRLPKLAEQPALMSMQANALEILGRTDQAGALYARLHQAWGSGMPEFLNEYARHLLRAGKWDAAAQTAMEATQVDPVNQEAWAYLATAWRLMGDPREEWLCDYDQLIGMIEIEAPSGFSDQADFLKALESSLARLHKAHREPMQQSLRGGSQTPGRLFGRKDPVLVAAQSSLLRGVEQWLGTLPSNDRHPFLMRKARSVRFGGSWSVKLWSSGNHVNHIHPEGWMSSAFYVSLPPSIGSASDSANRAGHIQFGQPPLELELGLPPRRVIRPEAGKLALFPSYMWHGTVPFEDVRPRLTVAFDMTPLMEA